MNKLILICAAVAVLFFASVQAGWDNPCEKWTKKYCAFRFAGYSSRSYPPVFDISGTPDKPISPRIYLGNKKVESANSQSFYFKNEDGSTEDGDEDFENHQFYVTQNRVRISTFNKNPFDEAAERCVVVPLSSYKLEGSNVNCNYPSDNNDDECVEECEACVVFGTKC